MHSHIKYLICISIDININMYIDVRYIDQWAMLLYLLGSTVLHRTEKRVQHSRMYLYCT